MPCNQDLSAVKFEELDLQAQSEFLVGGAQDCGFLRWNKTMAGTANAQGVDVFKPFKGMYVK
eukprot:1353464-Amphidinium_carterae.1